MCTLTHTIKTNARIMSSTIILKFKVVKNIHLRILDSSIIRHHLSD